MFNKNQIRAADVRFRVMRLLQENPAVSQRDIASALGLSVGGVNFCLNALVKKGFVKMRSFQESNDKRKYAYLLTPKRIVKKTTLTGQFLQRKIREYEVLRIEIEAIEKEILSEPKPDQIGIKYS